MLDRTKQKGVLKIKINGAEATILNPDSYILEKLRTCLSYVDSSIDYQNTFVKGKYQNPVVSLVQKNKFLTGLLARASATINNCGYGLSITSELKPVHPLPFGSVEYPEYLYDHQIEIIKAALEYKRCIIQSPTGSGKTVALSYLLKHFPENEIVVVVPEQNLMEQNAQAIEAIIGEKVGRVSGKKKDWKRVTVGVINSLALSTKDNSILKHAQVLIVDECHRAGNGKYFNMLNEAMVNTDYRIGLSATPNREGPGDTLFMEGVLGAKVLTIDIERLIAKNIIMRPHFFVIENPVEEGMYSNYNNKKGCYNTPNGKPLRYEVYIHGVVNNENRNRVICSVVKDYVNCEAYKEFPGMILVESLEHGLLLQEKLSKILDTEVPFVSGQTKAKERTEVLDDLRENKVRLAIASRVFNEGQDVPRLGLGIIASGGAAENRVIQQVGRFIRASKNKMTPIVIDFRDVEYYYLLANSRKRIKIVSDRFYTCPRTIQSSDLLNKSMFNEKGVEEWVLHSNYDKKPKGHY